MEIETINREGLYTATVIARSEQWENMYFNIYVRGDFEFEHGFHSCDRRYEDSYLYEILSDCPVSELIELWGPTKLTGYPDIETVEDVTKLHDRTRKYIEITYESIDEVINTTRRDLECIIYESIESVNSWYRKSYG